ncbi:MAG: BspA family leucine-rich repeat surface protein [Bacteroidales bacterium]|nr:BspA family leucine-rich repeat surface protein [Bacteroidales bacterium]
MKKGLFALLATVAVIASCQKEINAPEKELEDTLEIVQPSVPKVIYADIDSDETKAGMDRYYDDGTSSYKYRHHWENGDVIYVYEGTSVTTYTCTNAATGEFTEVSTSTIPNGRSFTNCRAVYSTVGPVSVTANDKVSILNTDAYGGYVSSSDTPGYGNFMVASTDDGIHFRFVSQVGWVKLQLKGTKTVKSISMSKYGSGEEYEGRYEYDFSTDTYSFDESQGESLTVTLDSPIALDPDTPTDFYFAFPAMSYVGMSFEFAFDGGGYDYLSTAKTVVVERNTVTPMAVKEVGFRSTLCSGVNFNVTLKSLAAGTTMSVGDADNLIKGIVFSLGEASPAATSVNLADSGKPIYATFDAGSGLITLHTAADIVTLNSECAEMFRQMTALESAAMLSQVALSKVGVISMFKGCASLESVDLSKLDVSEAISFSNMFNGCSALTGLDLSTLNTSSATTFTYMFGGCAALTSLDLSGFDTKKVTDFSYMFNDCTSLASIDFGTSFFKNNLIRTLDGMFANCSSLGSVNLTKSASASFETNTPYSTMAIICFGCTSLTSFTLPLPGRVTSFLQAFMNCTNLEVIDLDAVQDYSNPNYNQMFRECRKLNTLKVSNWYCPTLSSGTTTDYNRNMFLGTCAESAGLDIYISSSQYTWLGYYFNATMNASGFVTRHNPNL